MNNLLKNKRCLVLGGSGFIGTNLCLELRDKVKSLRVFDSAPMKISGIEWFQGDFLCDEDINSCTKDIDIVFHLITTSTPASSMANPIKDAEQNIIQSLRLLESCRMNNVKKVVFISSGGTVYGDCDSFPISENTIENPICAYGVSKVAIEKYLRLYEHLYGIKAVILRLSNPYGPFQLGKKQQGVIGTFISKILNGEDIEIWGNGKVVRDYIYIDDVIEAIIKSASYNGRHNTFNIGSGVGLSLLDIISSIDKALDSNVNIKFVPSRSIDVKKNELDCSRAKKEFGFEIKVNIDKGVSKTVTWLHDNKKEIQ